MLSRILPIMTLLLSSCLLTGAAVHPQCVNQGYATFYDSNDCTGTGGTAVSLGNPGCLSNEIGRNSIYIQAPCVGIVPNLVWSPGTDCNCQNECMEVPNGAASGCWNLNGNEPAQSFRFQSNDCGPNNC